MRILLDTHCWLWSLSASKRLDEQARAIITDHANTIYLSAVSAWKIAIKYSAGKLPLPEAPDFYVPSRMRAQDIESLPIEHAHALKVAHLPFHHRDPFDRLLIAQAMVENLSLMTIDPVIKKYNVDLIWAGLPSPKS